ncbi:SDR family oxidoreductase [Streptomyces sp. NPDC047515]|uniref:SDR family NAD(P)-dependent oxidoreductase n=1 Tax=Streptomyces sp. NPDC047515 TaxID=3155380 RepID=UPI0033EEDF13
MNYADSLSSQLAVVTGASSGIGTEFARQLARRGVDLVLVARSQDRLEALASTLSSQYGVKVTPVVLDLSRPDSSERLVRTLDEMGAVVDVLVNNAGFASHGDLAAADPERMEAQVQLNVGTLVGTTTRLLRGMVERGRGSVINVASTAGFQAVPHMAVYSATKAFVLSFTRSLWGETRGTGVAVLGICPGATDTAFFDVAGDNASVGSRRTPQQVVDTALSALGGRKATVVDGGGNALVARAVSRLLPERPLIRIAERSVRPGSR